MGYELDFVLNFYEDLLVLLGVWVGFRGGVGALVGLNFGTFVFCRFDFWLYFSLWGPGLAFFNIF